jgi:ribosomal protein L37E
MDAAHLFCPQCGYDLFGIPEERCPECGFGYDHHGIRIISHYYHDQRRALERRCIVLAGFGVALASSPLSRSASLCLTDRMGLVGGGLLVTLLVGWMLNWPRREWISWLGMCSLPAVALFVLVTGLLVLHPEFARVLATLAAIGTGLVCLGLPEEFPFAALNLDPKYRRFVNVHDYAAAGMLGTCWLLAILSWLL